MYTIRYGIDLATLHLRVDAVRKESITRLGFEVHDTLIGVARDFDALNVGGGNDLVDECSVLRGEIGETCDVDFVDDEDGGFVGEEGFD